MAYDEASEVTPVKVLWVHNFRSDLANSGVFMWEFFKHLKQKPGVSLDIHYINVRNVKHLLANFRKLQQLAEYYDVIHVQYGSIVSLFVGLVLRRRDIFKIVTIRGSDWYYLKHKKLRSRLHSFLSTKATRLSLNMYDVVLPVSMALEREISNFRCHLRTKVVVDPVDAHLFTIKDKTITRARLGFDTKRKYVLFASVDLDNEIKRYRMLQSAISICIACGHDVEIITATGVDHKNMCDLYNAADLICLPSVYEGWPNVIKEALYCGLPFVSTDMSDLKFVANETCGMCLISEAVPEKLAKNLSLVLENDLSVEKRLSLRAIGINIASMDKRKSELLSVYQMCRSHG